VINDVTTLSRHLRSLGIAVAPSEIGDASVALGLVPAAHRREALNVTLVKTVEHRRALSTVAELFLPQITDPAEQPEPPPKSTESPSGPAALDDDQLHALLLEVLAGGDLISLGPVAAELVDRHAHLVPGQPVAGNLAALRAFRGARADALRESLMGTEGGPGGPVAAIGALRRRQHVRLVNDRIERLRQEIEAEVRRRLVGERGATDLARVIQQNQPGDDDVLTGAKVDANRMNAVLDSLHRRLTDRLARTGVPASPGALDGRRTVRRALSTGGVPVDLVFRPRRPNRPSVFVLADISGSVASFARFTLGLTSKLQQRQASARSFVFVDEVDEVTDLLAGQNDLATAVGRIDREHRGVRYDAHSDYGQAFSTFERTWGHQLSATSVVLVLGDGRNNYRAPRTESLRRIRNRAGRLWWLNPERRAAWGDGDSVMPVYAPICDAVFECRSLSQLGSALSALR
jgi:uncharacterized protein with von Willebrand factor type A (vWA) domain